MHMGLWDELLWFGCLDRGECLLCVSLLVEFGKIDFNINPFSLIKVLPNSLYADYALNTWYELQWLSTSCDCTCYVIINL